MSSLPNERRFTRQETAKLLRVSIATLNRISRSGKISKYRVGAGRVLFGEHHIADYLKSSEEPACILEEAEEVEE
jgi:excisionase family DNA binding protein